MAARRLDPRIRILTELMLLNLPAGVTTSEIMNYIEVEYHMEPSECTIQKDLELLCDWLPLVVTDEGRGSKRYRLMPGGDSVEHERSD